MDKKIMSQYCEKIDTENNNLSETDVEVGMQSDKRKHTSFIAHTIGFQNLNLTFKHDQGS